MTREEAIYRLKNTAWLGSDDDREEAEEAVVMAIKALEDIERWRAWSHTYDNLISRADAINCCSCLHPEDCWDEIRKLPSADAVATFRTGQTYGKSTSIRELVEVVRCKDCKYAEPYDDSTYPIHCSYDFPMTEQGTWVKPNDFCSNGERMSND